MALGVAAEYPERISQLPATWVHERQSAVSQQRAAHAGWCTSLRQAALAFAQSRGHDVALLICPHPNADLAAVFMVSAGARAATTGRAASGGATRADAEASSRQTKVRRRNIGSWRAG